MLLLLGLPLMFLELALGQYAALGPSVVFDRLCPLFHGKYLLNFITSVIVKASLLKLSQGVILNNRTLIDVEIQLLHVKKIL